MRSRIIALLSILLLLNLAAWAWALLEFRAFPVLLGTALLAYSLGLRHAVDADHIAAIDNVTRKLMQQGQRPVAVGLFFSLGHSTVVWAASAVLAAATVAFKTRLAAWHEWGGLLGTIVSAGFLIVIALINFTMFRELYREFRRVRMGGDLDGGALMFSGGPLARLFRPLFRVISQSWHMYPLGFLFGLGFDTATEVSLLGISAVEASRGLPIWSIMTFPALFTAGMALVDTADGVMMLGIYGWAFIKPLRKLFYNMTLTLISVLVAVIVGGVELLGLIGSRVDGHGAFWSAVGGLNDHFGMLGYLIVAIFALSWLVSAMIYRARGYDLLGAE